LLVALLAVPGVRAGVLRWLQIGAVRIFLVATETPSPAPSATGTRPAATRTPPPSATPLGSVLDIAGETTLAGARARVSFPIRLPTYPPDLGEPDRIFVQTVGSADGTAVVLVWLAPDEPDQVRLALYVLASPVMADKIFFDLIKKAPPEVELTDVNGQPAVWTSGPYVLMTDLGGLREYRLIQGQVLIWQDGELTYRLETELALEEAVRIAESLE
jgi:hypothetical protein